MPNPLKRRNVCTTDPALLENLRGSIVAAPRESINGLVDTVSCQDAMDFLRRIPDESVELMFTDEPYSVEPTQITFNARVPLSTALEWDADMPAHLRMPWVYEAYRILKPGGSLLNFGIVRWTTNMHDMGESAGFKWKASIFWCKTNVAPQVRKQNYRSSYEMLWWMCKPPIKGHFNFQTQQEMRNWIAETSCPYCHARHPVFHSNSYEIPDWWAEFSPLCSDPGRVHPTEKPAWLITKYILIHSNPGDIVCDPFTGSGVIPWVAARLGRRYIANDFDPQWADYTRERLSMVQESVF